MNSNLGENDIAVVHGHKGDIKSKSKDEKVGERCTTRARAIDTKTLVKIAICGGMMAAIRFATAFYPSVELMTLLMVVFAISFGPWQALSITLVFNLIEFSIYGQVWYLFTAMIYWPIMALAIGFVGRTKIKHIYKVGISVAIGIIFTCFFAALSTATGTILGLTFFPPFADWIAVNAPYMIPHIVGNVVILTALVWPLSLLVKKLNLGNKVAVNVDKSESAQEQTLDTDNKLKVCQNDHDSQESVEEI